MFNDKWSVNSSQVRGAPWYDGALEDSSPAEPKEEQLRNEARKLYTMAFEACAMALKGSQEPWTLASCDGIKMVRERHQGESMGMDMNPWRSVPG